MRLLQVVGLKAMPMRGRSLTIEFALTKEAQTQVEVLTLTGQRVAIGDWSKWDGRKAISYLARSQCQWRSITSKQLLDRVIALMKKVSKFKRRQLQG